jgi:flagellar hook-associated protein 3 FlgL
MTPLPASTGLYYQRSKAQMATLTAKADLLQTQVATTKRLQVASDDTVAYGRLQRIARATADAGVYEANLDLAGSLLAQTDTTLAAMTTQVQRASELVLNASTGTVDPVARKAIGAEMAEIVKALADLANTTDTRGQPLMGGADGAPAVALVDGRYVLSTAAPAAIPVADGQAVAATETAARALTLGDGRDVLNILAALATQLGTGEPLSDSGDAIDDLGASGDQLAAVRASVGARAARVDLVQAQATEIATDRETERSSLEDTDIAAAIADLQQTMTVLSATQASFSKLSQLSLFDYLR